MNINEMAEERDAFYYECIKHVINGAFQDLISHITSKGPEIVKLERKIRQSRKTNTARMSISRKNEKRRDQLVKEFGFYGNPTDKDKDRIERVVLENGSADRGNKIHNAKRNAGKTRKSEKLFYRGLHAFRLGEQEVAEIFFERTAEVHDIDWEFKTSEEKALEDMSEKEILERLDVLKNAYENKASS